MSSTNVSNLCLTVSTVKVFIQTMEFISEFNLWKEVQAYLKENGKTDMFVDYEAFFLVREMIMQDSRFDGEHPLLNILMSHIDPKFDRYTKPSSNSDSV